MRTPLEQVLGCLPDAKRSGSGWKAKCPAHDDNDPSLSISEGDDGKALVHCHAGCTPEEVVKAMGLNMSDLMVPTASTSTQIARTRENPQLRRHDDRNQEKKMYPTSEAAITNLERQHGPRSKVWTYEDAEGKPAGHVVRWEKDGGGKDIRPVSRRSDGWVVCGMQEPRPLYGLPKLAEADRVYVCEGEKAAEAARSIGLTATTSPHGANSAAKADWTPLAGKGVVILPDNDAAGTKYADEVRTILSKLKPAPMVKLVELLDLREGGDIFDWLDARKAVIPKQFRQEIEEMADAAPEWKPKARNDDGVEKEGGSEQPKKSQSTVLVEMARAAVLWHTPDQEAYATFTINGHAETWRIRSRGFKQWLSRQYYLETKRSPSSQAISDAMNTIEGISLFEGGEYSVHTRVAEHNENIYIDLADPDWRVVEVTEARWQILDNPPVRFRRSKSMLPLPVPVEGGSIDDLRTLINVSDADWPIVLGWLVSAMRPTGPYPLLCLSAEQGSGKSTVARTLRSLVDPNTAPLRSEPREPRDLMISATNSWVIALDNLSGIRVWLSDGLCRLSTGGGFATRELYANGEETIFEAMRPAILTGIEELATRSDLLDRSLLISLPRILADRRRSEKDYWADFQRKAPSILGAILTAISMGIKKEPTTKLDSLPRMADFAIWATACEPALGLKSGEFMAAYQGNRDASNELALEVSPIGRAILDLMVLSHWEGTASELQSTLEAQVDDKTRQLKAWPKSPCSLSGALKRLAPNLRELGVDVKFSREPGGTRRRIITLERQAGNPCVPTVPLRPEGEDSLESGPQTSESGTQGGTQNQPDGTQNSQDGTQGDATDANMQPGSIGSVDDTPILDDWGEI